MNIKENRKNKTYQHETEAYPDAMPGLNIREGMRRLGQWRMYADLVNFFCRDKKDFPIKIREQINAKDYNTAEVMAHSLKGSAATISAPDLFNAAKALEQSCQNRDENQIEAALNALEEAFEQVMASSEVLHDLMAAQKDEINCSDEASEAESYDFSALPELFRYLATSLDEFDPLGSEAYVRKVVRCIETENFDAHILAQVQELVNQVEIFEFAAAKEILQRLIEDIWDSRF